MKHIRWLAGAMAAAAALNLGACAEPKDENIVVANDSGNGVGAAVAANASEAINAADPAEVGNDAAAAETAENASEIADDDGTAAPEAAPEAEPPAAKPAPPPVAAKAVTASVERPKAFAMCATCHSTNEGDPHRIGPNLFGVVGSKAGSKPGYAYSDAMKASGIVWTPAKLQEFLLAPREMVPGTKMMVAAPKDEEVRRDIVAYLASLK